jgi:hypothetical protein
MASVKCSHLFLDPAAMMCEYFTYADRSLESKRIGSLENSVGKRRLETSRDPKPFLLAH